MSKRCTFIALSNQKGGVGKSTMTVLLASYFHYVKGKNVAVIDCDYPQFSIQALRSRDMKNVERSESLQQLLCRQYERTGKKAYPVLTSGPGKVLETADRLSGNSDILFFDLPGTVNTPGILEAIINMDYVFTPVVQDRMVMQSSLSFVATLRDFIRQYPEAPLKEILLFWNKIDGRVSREVYRHYNEIFEKIGLKTLSTVMPDMERYNKETSSGGQTFFRSTYFPPSEKLLKGSNMDVLAGEIERIIPSVREDADKPLPVSREPAGSGTSLPEKIQEYRKNFLNRKIAVHRKQTYICYDTYRRLARILPLLSDGMTVPAFLDNVLDHHLEVYEKELDEMVRLSTQNSH